MPSSPPDVPVTVEPANDAGAPVIGHVPPPAEVLPQSGASEPPAVKRRTRAASAPSSKPKKTLTVRAHIPWSDVEDSWTQGVLACNPFLVNRIGTMLCPWQVSGSLLGRPDLQWVPAPLLLQLQPDEARTLAHAGNWLYNSEIPWVASLVDFMLQAMPMVVLGGAAWVLVGKVQMAAQLRSISQSIKSGQTKPGEFLALTAPALTTPVQASPAAPVPPSAEAPASPGPQLVPDPIAVRAAAIAETAPDGTPFVPAGPVDAEGRPWTPESARAELQRLHAEAGLTPDQLAAQTGLPLAVVISMLAPSEPPATAEPEAADLPAAVPVPASDL